MRTRLHVLLIEDNPGDARLTELRLADSTLGKFGLTVVATLGAAVELLATTTPDVVLTDLSLPDASGLEAVRRLRADHPGLPIVAFTGAEPSHLGTLAIRSGADDYLSKEEVTGEILARTLRHAVERRRSAHALVAHITDGVVVLGDDGGVRFVNAAAVDMFGRPRDALIGRPLESLSRVGDGEELALVADEGEPRVVEVRRNRIDWYAEPAALFTLHDVTERRRADQLRARLERADRLAAMGMLAASVAHEINNALAVLSISLPMLRETVRATAAPRDLASFDDCILAADRIGGIVHEMRQYTPAGGSDVIIGDINDAVRDAIRLAAPRLRERARLRQNLGALPPVAFDLGQLSQIVVNLLLNAADAVAGSPNGGPERGLIEVSTRNEDDSVVICVTDNGPGVPEALRERIFDPFFTTKPKDSGTGLGLSVVADLVRRHGGTIGLDTTHAGARFEVHLPLAGGVVDRSPAPVAAPAALTNARIMVIDDDMAVAAALARLLYETREVVVAVSGREALALLEADADFDAIICDVMMPEMDGAEVYTQLRARFAALARRVVFVTGGVTTERARALIASGVMVLGKPFRLAQLEQAIASVMATAEA